MAKTELTGEYMTAQAVAWREANQDAWNRVVDMARKHVKLGMRFSMDQLMHHVRFEMASDGLSQGFKVNNNTVAVLSRMLRNEYPETCDYLEIRKSKVDWV